MNNIKNQFSISDFENLSGIKAHTIRMWEKRYNLFNPIRHGNNERLYDLDDLRKILNIGFLQQNGLKISKIVALGNLEIPRKVNEIITEKGKFHEAINQFKISMFSFDQELFNSTYQKLISQLSFREIFHEIFIPFLELIGLLWQSGTIVPAHEHFISQLIENKLHLNIEKVQGHPKRKDRTFVLFLPQNEMHNLGILFVQYEILLKGFHCLYLGSNIPVDDLKILQKIYNPIVFISQFTVAPAVEEIENFINKIQTEILRKNEDEFWIIGKKSQEVLKLHITQSLSTFKNVGELVKKV